MTSAIGRLVVDVLTNKSGGAVAYGDVVVLDSANDDAFTTDTSGAFTGIVGVCIEPVGIASNASGRIQTQGPVAQINCSASVTRGHYLKTHTVAKQAVDAGTSRVVGAFAKTKTTSATPKAILFGFPDAASSSAAAGSPGVTLSTTNSAGVAATFIATDATIAAFDATAPSTQAAGDAAAAGSAGTAARRDHKHAMPATTGFGILQASTVRLTGGDITTTSTTFTDLTGATTTITVGAHRCIVTFDATFTNSVNATNVSFDFNIAGSRVGQTLGYRVVANANTGGQSMSMSYLTDVLSAGSTVFKVQWKVAANTGTVYASAGVTPAILTVIETGLTT